MKLKCTQCGASIPVTSPDAWVHCTYCGARAAVIGFTGTSFLHRPVLSREDALRLFPAGAVATASIYWFPYDPSDLSRVFTQPYSEMEGYTPPSGDRRIWSDDTAEGTVIPVDPELLGEGGVVYHPFWVVILSSSGRGIIVDAVSGGRIGEASGTEGARPFDPFHSALSSFAVSLGPALLVFFLLRGLSLFWASVLGMAAAVFAPDIFRRIRGGKG